jgi:hypothetical protein
MAMTDLSTSHPKIFVSYSHDSRGHSERVLGLAQRLRADGFETVIDQYVEGTPPTGWPRWMLNQIEWADYILLVCTHTYYRRFRGLEAPDIGRGVDWEGTVITTELYHLKSVTQRFVPIFLEQADISLIPDPLRSHTFHALVSEEAYQKLINFLAGAAGIEPVTLGPQPERKRKHSQPLRFDGDNLTEPAIADSKPALDLRAHPAPGGTMSVEDMTYIERSADANAKAAAARLRGETVVVSGPHQFGKSSLLTHYIALSRKHGKIVASVDFSRFEQPVLTDYGRFLTVLATYLARRLQVKPPSAPLRTQQELLEFLEYELLPALNCAVIFSFDETDRIMKQDYAQDFFAMVRSWHNDRSDPESLWHKVGLALASSSEPKLYIRDAMRSPFSVGLRLSLDSFSVEQVTQLNACYGAPLSSKQCGALHVLLGGHPFLTQEAFYKLLGPDAMPFGHLCAQAARHDGPFGEHLRATLSNIRSAEGQLASFKQAIQHGSVPRMEDFYRLEGAGLVRKHGAQIVPTSQIYADFFRDIS